MRDVGLHAGSQSISTVVRCVPWGGQGREVVARCRLALLRAGAGGRIARMYTACFVWAFVQGSASLALALGRGGRTAVALR